VLPKMLVTRNRWRQFTRERLRLKFPRHWEIRIFHCNLWLVS
jgi:hypothetical protein